jgi:hydrogenase/urease accessory protein HupE
MWPLIRPIFELCVLAFVACAGVSLAMARGDLAFAAVFAAQASFAPGVAIGFEELDRKVARKKETSGLSRSV